MNANEPWPSLRARHYRAPRTARLGRSRLPFIHTDCANERLTVKTPEERPSHPAAELKQILSPNDVADATAVALCRYHGVRFAA